MKKKLISPNFFEIFLEKDFVKYTVCLLLTAFLIFSLILSFYYNSLQNEFYSTTNIKLETLNERLERNIEQSKSDLNLILGYGSFLVEKNPDYNPFINRLLEDVLRKNNNLYQARILDRSGMENFKFYKPNRSNQVLETPASQLQNKSHRYYFKELEALDYDTFYYSLIDLNIENNRIEVPFRPTIRIGKKIQFYNFHGTLYTAYVYLNHSLDLFFRDIEDNSIVDFEESNNRIFFIDQEGYYLKHPNPDLQWGRDLENFENNFFKTYDKELLKTDMSNRVTSFWLNSRSVQIGDFTYYFVVEKSAQEMLQLLWGRSKYVFYLLILFLLISFYFLGYHLRSKRLKQESNSKLKIANDEYFKIAKQKDEIYSIVAHDLRSPFTSLIGFSEIILKDFEKLSADQIQSFVKLIHESSNQTLNMLDNLLSWIQSSSSEMKPKMKSIALKEFINDFYVQIKVSLDKKNISFINQLKGDEVVLFDRRMLEVVLRNIVNNAIKFTHEQGEITFQITEESDFYELEIRDNGIGIPKNHLDSIFDLGFSRSRLGTNLEKGTGLGLSLCKNFMQLNDGAIRLTSEEGKGTSFYLKLRKK